MKKLAGDIIILQKFTKNQSYEVQFLKYGVRSDISFCNFGPFFAILLPPSPPNNWENQNFKKVKKAYEDVII